MSERNLHEGDWDNRTRILVIKRRKDHIIHQARNYGLGTQRN